MFGSLFGDAVNLIEKWRPKQKYSNENRYRDDLANFLRKEFKERQDSFLFGSGERVSIKKEAGRGLCDIAINEQIGIELKKDLSKKKQVDRLMGQLIDYKKAYEDIIIVLVGKTNKDALELLRDKVSELNKESGIGFGLSQTPRIKIIDKASKTKKSRSKDLFDLGAFKF
jgi:hypothetical protein